MRRVVKRHDTHLHFINYRADAASGAPCQRTWLQERARERADVWNQLPSYANPIPTAQEFIAGIDHHNSNPDHQGVKWDVVRALQSTKMHYLTQLKKFMEDPASGGNLERKFQEAFPNLMPPSGGMEPLDDGMWQRLEWEFNVNTEADYVKHILTKHDGEARLVHDIDKWEPFQASGGNVYNARFWHYQFVSTAVTRRYLWNRSQEKWGEDDMTASDIEWILKQENNTTKLLMYIPASGGYNDRWMIKTGNYITLGSCSSLAPERARASTSTAPTRHCISSSTRGTIPSRIRKA